MSCFGSFHVLTALPRPPSDKGDTYEYETPIQLRSNPNLPPLPPLPTKFVKGFSHSVEGLTLADIIPADQSKEILGDYDVKSLIILPQKETGTSTSTTGGQPLSYNGSSLLLISKHKSEPNRWYILERASLLHTGPTERSITLKPTELPDCHWTSTKEKDSTHHGASRHYSGTLGTVVLDLTSKQFYATLDPDVRVAVPEKGSDSDWGPLIWPYEGRTNAFLWWKAHRRSVHGEDVVSAGSS